MLLAGGGESVPEQPLETVEYTEVATPNGEVAKVPHGVQFQVIVLVGAVVLFFLLVLIRHFNDQVKRRK
jgi:hypothetical protein